MKTFKLLAFGVLPLLSLAVVLFVQDHRSEKRQDDVASGQQNVIQKTSHVPEPGMPTSGEKKATSRSIDFQKRRDELDEKNRELMAKIERTLAQRSPEARQQTLNGVIKYREEKLQPLFDSWQLDEQKRKSVMAIISEWETFKHYKPDNEIKSMNTMEYQASTQNAQKILNRNKAEELTELALAETRLMDVLGKERFKELDRVWRRPITAD